MDKKEDRSLRRHRLVRGDDVPPLPNKHSKFVEGRDGRTSPLREGTTSKEGALKFDTEKPRPELLPVGASLLIAEVFTFGAEKYGDWNYMKGMKWMRLYGALLRHMYAWVAGRDSDPESGKSHLAHAGCCIMMLLEYEARGIGEDDRPKVSVPPID